MPSNWVAERTDGLRLEYWMTLRSPSPPLHFPNTHKQIIHTHTQFNTGNMAFAVSPPSGVHPTDANTIYFPELIADCNARIVRSYNSVTNQRARPMVNDCHDA